MPNKPINKEDYQFLEDIRQQMETFVNSDEEVLEFPAMNSYQRRLVHKLAADFKMKSHSVGEEERYVCLMKSPESAVPEKKYKEPVHDQGDQMFYAAPNTKIVLRSDGSFGIPLESDHLPVIDERVVTTGGFRIRKSKIVCAGDAGW